MSPDLARPGAALPGPTGLPAPLTDLTRTLVMGVVNVTPDSFSDGGDFLDADAAIAHGLALVADGADLVDIGGESTRPGAARVDAAEELRRVLPVVRALAAEGVVVSIDTMRASVAAATLEAGAALLNDVSGGQADEAMARVVADTGTPYVVMHWRGHSADMASRAVYADVVTEVVDELRGRLDALSAAGVDLDRVSEHFAARCRAVVRIPFDAHLEEGAEIDLDRLEPSTRMALLELAANVADAFERVHAL